MIRWLIWVGVLAAYVSVSSAQQPAYTRDAAMDIGAPLCIIEMGPGDAINSPDLVYRLVSMNGILLPHAFGDAQYHADGSIVATTYEADGWTPKQIMIWSSQGQLLGRVAGEAYLGYCGGGYALLEQTVLEGTGRSGVKTALVHLQSGTTVWTLPDSFEVLPSPVWTGYLIASQVSDGSRLLINMAGEPAFDGPKEMLGWASEGVVAFRHDGQWGLMTCDGEEILRPQFDVLFGGLSEGTVRVAQGGAMSVISIDGTPMLNDATFEYIGGGQGLVYPVKDARTDRWGVVGRDGKWLSPTRYDFIGDFSEGLAAFFNEDNEQQSLAGFVDLQGNEHFVSAGIVRPVNPQLVGFRNGMAFVKGDMPGESRVIKRDGQVIWAESDICESENRGS